MKKIYLLYEGCVLKGAFSKNPMKRLVNLYKDQSGKQYKDYATFKEDNWVDEFEIDQYLENGK